MLFYKKALAMLMNIFRPLPRNFAIISSQASLGHIFKTFVPVRLSSVSYFFILFVLGLIMVALSIIRSFNCTIYTCKFLANGGSFWIEIGQLFRGIRGRPKSTSRYFWPILTP